NYGDFVARCDRRIFADFPLGGSFVNVWTFEKAGTAGTTTLQLNFYNQVPGLVDVESGALNFTRGGFQLGQFTVASGAVLRFSVDTQTLGDGVRFSGQGTVTVANRGRLDLAQSATVNADVNLVLDSVTPLTGAGRFLSWRSLTWSSGTISPGELDLSGTMTINGEDQKRLDSTLVLSSANITWTDTGDISLSRSTFQNLGSFTIQNGATLFGDDISSFQNLNGLVTKTTG